MNCKLQRLGRICVGWLRLHPFGFCPACNSDAPEKYDCTVCCNWNEGRPPKGLRQLWWKRFIDANKLVVLFAFAASLLSGCTATRVRVDGNQWSVYRLSIFQKVANQRIEVEGVGLMEGYQNDGGSDVLCSVVTAAIQAGAQSMAQSVVPIKPISGAVVGENQGELK